MGTFVSFQGYFFHQKEHSRFILLTTLPAPTLVAYGRYEGLLSAPPSLRSEILTGFTRKSLRHHHIRLEILGNSHSKGVILRWVGQNFNNLYLYL